MFASSVSYRLFFTARNSQHVKSDHTGCIVMVQMIFAYRSAGPEAQVRASAKTSLYTENISPETMAC